MARGEKTKLLWGDSEYRKKMSKAHLGKIHNGSFKKGHKINVGKKYSEERRRKISIAQKGSRGHNWQGGKTEITARIRNSLEYKLWREAVFKRDDYACNFV